MANQKKINCTDWSKTSLQHPENPLFCRPSGRQSLSYCSRITLEGKGSSIGRQLTSKGSRLQLPSTGRGNWRSNYCQPNALTIRPLHPSKSELGFTKHSCAFVSVMEVYYGPRRQGTVLCLLRISRLLRLLIVLRLLNQFELSFKSMVLADWLAQYKPTIIY